MRRSITIYIAVEMFTIHVVMRGKIDDLKMPRRLQCENGFRQCVCIYLIIKPKRVPSEVCTTTVEKKKRRASHISVLKVSRPCNNLTSVAAWCHAARIHEVRQTGIGTFPLAPKVIYKVCI